MATTSPVRPPGPPIYGGVDLGGTKILALLVSPDGKIIGRAKRPTDASRGVQGVAEDVRELLLSAVKPLGTGLDALGGVGVAVPGGVNPETGDILHAPNLGWRDIPVRPVFEQVLGRQVFLGNDVNCGVLGEHRHGAAKGFRNVAGFFVGTGLGGGVIVNGRIVNGVKGVGGEFGHVKIKHGGRVCGCGGRGCLEAYCSKVAFAKRFQKLLRKGLHSAYAQSVAGRPEKLKSRALGEAYRAGDPVVREVLDGAMRTLGMAAANIVAVLGPECIVFAGGVMEELGHEIMPRIREGFEANLFGVKPADICLRLTTLGGDAGALGAASMAMDG